MKRYGTHVSDTSADMRAVSFHCCPQLGQHPLGDNETIRHACQRHERRYQKSARSQTDLARRVCLRSSALLVTALVSLTCVPYRFIVAQRVLSQLWATMKRYGTHVGARVADMRAVSFHCCPQLGQHPLGVPRSLLINTDAGVPAPGLGLCRGIFHIPYISF